MASAAILSPVQHHMLGTPERSYDESNQSVEAHVDQWRELAYVISFSFHVLYQRNLPILYYSKILRDAGPTLSPDDELGDIAAAEASVIAKDGERSEIVEALQTEVTGTLSGIHNTPIKQAHICTYDDDICSTEIAMRFCCCCSSKTDDTTHSSGT